VIRLLRLNLKVPIYECRMVYLLLCGYMVLININNKRVDGGYNCVVWVVSIKKGYW
jgi:hypothetical protein